MKQSNDVDCLKKLYAFKGSRTTFKRLDYDTIKLLKLDFLPLVLNNNVIFELPSIESFVGNY